MAPVIDSETDIEGDDKAEHFLSVCIEELEFWETRDKDFKGQGSHCGECGKKESIQNMISEVDWQLFYYQLAYQRSYSANHMTYWPSFKIKASLGVSRVGNSVCLIILAPD